MVRSPTEPKSYYLDPHGSNPPQSFDDLSRFLCAMIGAGADVHSLLAQGRLDRFYLAAFFAAVYSAPGFLKPYWQGIRRLHSIPVQVEGVTSPPVFKSFADAAVELCGRLAEAVDDAVAYTTMMKSGESWPDYSRRKADDFCKLLAAELEGRPADFVDRTANMQADKLRAAAQSVPFPAELLASMCEWECEAARMAQSTEETSAGAANGWDTNRDTKKTSDPPPMPDTLGFREYYERCRKAQSKDEHFNKTAVAQELASKYDVKPETLRKALNRYLRALNDWDDGGTIGTS